MAAANETIVIQVSSVEKRALSNAARRLGLDISQMIGQAARELMPDDKNRDFDALIDRLHSSTMQADQALDHALASIAASNQRIAAMEAAKL
jgi:hypothetical protein